MREMAKYLNDTGAPIQFGIGSAPGAPLTRYDSEPGQVLDGPASYSRAFRDAGYTLVTETVQRRLDIEAQDKVRAEELAKAEAEAKAAAEKEAAEAEAKAKAEAEAKAAATAEQPLPDKPTAEHPLKGRRGSDRSSKS